VSATRTEELSFWQIRSAARAAWEPRQQSHAIALRERAEHEWKPSPLFKADSAAPASVIARPREVADFQSLERKGHHMLKISVPVLAATLLAGSAAFAAGSAAPRATNPSVDAKAQTTASQPAAVGDHAMSAAKKAAKKTKKTKQPTPTTKSM
jgi:hypothetical protein